MHSGRPRRDRAEGGAVRTSSVARRISSFPPGSRKEKKKHKPLRGTVFKKEENSQPTLPARVKILFHSRRKPLSERRFHELYRQSLKQETTDWLRNKVAEAKAGGLSGNKDALIKKLIEWSAASLEDRTEALRSSNLDGVVWPAPAFHDEDGDGKMLYGSIAYSSGVGETSYFTFDSVDEFSDEESEGEEFYSESLARTSCVGEPLPTPLHTASPSAGTGCGRGRQRRGSRLHPRRPAARRKRRLRRAAQEGGHGRCLLVHRSG